ncbi:MAG: hypothetical protein INR69_06725 [Mucilaginibacter polytrichastri]|nr:hypothetical protein [Mucilaginibacter polytrichastri]
MIAIIYSGSRFAIWKLVYKGRLVEQFNTNGINPFFQDKKHLVNIFGKKTELINHAEDIRQVYFFGAGASSKERQHVVQEALQSYFRFAKVHVYHDMDAIALTSCDHKPGIIGIIGSGSNVAYYDGRKVRPNNFGLGYVLGDEGSSNWFGRQLLRGYLNQSMPEHLRMLFAKKYAVDRKVALEKVYRNAQPVHYLSSFSEFMGEHREDPYCRELIRIGFGKLFDLYVVPIYAEHAGLPVYFAGSVAGSFHQQLREAAEEKQIEVTDIVKEPVHNLLNYYINKN